MSWPEEPLGWRARFEELFKEWERETCLMSSLTDICQHRAYRAVIDLGSNVFPLLLEEMRDTWFWHWALVEITGENPTANAAEEVAPAMLAWNAGRVRAAWLGWGREKGMLAAE